MKCVLISADSPLHDSLIVTSCREKLVATGAEFDFRDVLSVGAVSSALGAFDTGVSEDSNKAPIISRSK